MSLLQNFTKEKLQKYNKNDIRHLVTTYIDVCNNLDVNPDNVFLIENVENVEFEEIWIISNFLISYENICIINSYEEKEVNSWFKRRIEGYPFDNKTPLQCIIKSLQKKVSILQLRIYTTAMLTAYKNQK